MYKIAQTNAFRKDLKAMIKRGVDISLLDEIVTTLARGESLDFKYRDHPLTGNYKGSRECHIKPDWLLIYCIENDVLVLTLMRTGSHSDLF